MSQNKTVCIHITKERIYLLEGKINDGILLVSKTAMVKKAARFFFNERLAYMSDMVQAIINTMTVNSFTAKQVYIVYDNNLDVEFYLNENIAPAQRENSGTSLGSFDLKALFGGKNENANEATKPLTRSKSSGLIRHRKQWGIYITDNEQGEMYTTVSVERDLVEYLIMEFQSQGYKVLSIEPPDTVLLYLRKFVPFTYDALNKIVLYADDEEHGTIYMFTKDCPSGVKQVTLDTALEQEFEDAVIDLILEETSKNKLRNPVVMLAGRAFRNEDRYLLLCDKMRDEKINIIDIYGLWHDKSQPYNMIRTAVPTEGVDIELNAQFGVCVGMLMRTMEQKPENLIEGSHPMFIDKQVMTGLCSVVKTAAIVFALYTLSFAGISGYEVKTANDEILRVSNTTTYQLSIAERERDTAQEKLAALGTIDERFDDIFKFVYSEVSTNLNIASVDTINMIPLPEQSSSIYAEGNAQTTETTGTTKTTDEEKDVTDTASALNRELQTIIIRGYSRTSDGPVELYRDLTSAGMGEVKIVGIEQVPLPSSETIFAFEMTVGAG